MKTVIDDATNFCCQIKNTIFIEKKYIVINFTSSEYKKEPIRTSDISGQTLIYPYKFEGTLSFLKKRGVIQDWVFGYFFLDIVSPRNEEYSKENIDSIAKKYGIIEKSDQTVLYAEVGSLFEERESGFAVIDIHELNLFLQIINNKTIALDEQSGEFKYLGEVIKLNGDLQIKTLKLLISNLNSIVPFNEFYVIRGIENYEKLKQNRTATKIHEPLEQMFKDLRKKFETNKLLKKALVFVQRDGFGLFINQSY